MACWQWQAGHISRNIWPLPVLYWLFGSGDLPASMQPILRAEAVSLDGMHQHRVHSYPELMPPGYQRTLPADLQPARSAHRRDGGRGGWPGEIAQ